MPKRYGKLWTRICEESNIRHSISVVLSRRRSKGKWGEQEQYIVDHLDEVVSQIQSSLTNRTYEFGDVRHFKRRERRKVRTIDHLDVYHSIYLQAVMEICQPLFIEKYIPTTYSSIKGRGLIQMSMEINRFIRKHPDYHFILIDETKCYENVDHAVMLDILRRNFKDIYLLEFFERLLAMIENGVALGFSTNHYLVNLLFSPMCHRLRKMKHVQIFQYMDDTLVFCPKEISPGVYKVIEEEVEKIHQHIKPNVRFAPIDYGIDYCGFVYYTNEIRLRKEIKRSMQKRDQELRKNNVPDDIYKQKMAPYWGWCKYCNGAGLWKSILKDKIYLFEKQMKSFSDIAEGKDKSEQYEGEYWMKNDILEKNIEFLKFRKTTCHGKEKYIVQACIDGQYGYFFTEAIGITDKLERYSAELPFSGTIKELTNKRGQKYMTIV